MKKVILTGLIILTTGLAVSLKADETSIHRFKAHGVDLTHNEISDYPSHLLGDTIARKTAAFRALYVRRYSTSVGFSNTTVDIVKPAIYNSVSKIDSYLRKAVSRNNMCHKEAEKHLIKCLDVAYLAYYENTTELEAKLKKVRDAKQLISIFDNVVIEI